MKTELIFVFVALLIVACGNKSAQTETSEEKDGQVLTTRNLVNPQNRQDTVYFGYIVT